MPSVPEFSPFSLSELRQISLSFSQEIEPAQMHRLLEDSFGESPDDERLLGAARLGLVTARGELVAGACIEASEDRSAYVWLMAVREADRRRGIGTAFLRAITEWCSAQNLCSVRLKTYERWAGIRHILLGQHWAMASAEFSKRNDGVGEIWQIPLLHAPLGVVVVGASPNGRGSEWIENVRSCPDWWRLEAVVDPNAEARKHWEARGVTAVPEVKAIESDRVNAAIVAVPPRFAVPIQRSCFERGWGVLVEKPLAASLDELLELQDDFWRRQPALVVGVQRRSHPSYVALKAFLKGHDLRGLSVGISLGKDPKDSPDGHRADPRQCRGGALLDLGYHALDLAHFLIGRPIDMVACSLTRGNDLASGIESGAELLGRAGNTWVRVRVDRHGKKGEQVCAETDEGVWLANREGLTSPDGTQAYSCAGSWALAERGRLSALAAACLQPKLGDCDLWDHLSLFETIERAYSSAGQIGLKGGA